MDPKEAYERIEGYQDGTLTKALADVEAYVQGWWKQNYMPQFTDHGPAHVSRVVEYALLLVPPTLQPGSEFTALELFALCAAGYLHDIGMQKLVAQEHPLGEVDPSDYAAVRRVHPKETFDLIVDQATKIGLPNDPN